MDGDHHFLKTMSACPVGKKVGKWLYLHMSALKCLSKQQQKKIKLACEISSLRPFHDFNIIKIHSRLRFLSISLLSYEDIFQKPFPALQRSWKVDLEKQSVQTRNYTHSSNPPILHRKELLLPPDDPHIETFRALTKDLEEKGLFQYPKRIGFLQFWNKRLAEAGFRIEGHTLIPFSSSATSVDHTSLQTSVHRHKTAIYRSGLSRPFQCLDWHGYLCDQFAVFDYGCGRGQDVYILRDNGIQAAGWDPYYAPENDPSQADVVNLGFVINVIENKNERDETLQRAFELSRVVLAVSAMLHKDPYSKAAAQYEDGVITYRGTFQKYYTQLELKEYIQQVLGKEPFAVGPGVFFVFQDQEEEQAFLHRRQQRSWSAILRLTDEAGGQQAAVDPAFRKVLDALWELILDLGRPPHANELPPELASDIQTTIGTLNRAMRLVWKGRERNEFEARAKIRSEDLLVYMALNLFSGRQAGRNLPEKVKRDIKAFYRTIKDAQSQAQSLLFAAGKRDEVLAACHQSAADGLGYLDGEHSLTIHAELVDRLPPVLRIFAGCAAQLIGDISAADVVKFHIQSAKLTLLMVDDFFGKAIPELRSRIKVNLRSQDIDFFEYGLGTDYQSLMYLKSRFMAADQERYDQQVAFDQWLMGMGCFDFSGYGPSAEAFCAGLIEFGLSLEDVQSKAFSL
jgi:DNA phosphorothioation-associated putative methyltransferase